MDTNIDISERLKQFKIDRFNTEKMNEIENAVNLFNFDIENNIFNDDKVEEGAKTFKTGN